MNTIIYLLVTCQRKDMCIELKIKTDFETWNSIKWKREKGKDYSGKQKQRNCITTSGNTVFGNGLEK